jgi:hypothetical protein
MRLVEATEAQKRERDPLTHPEWGTQLTVDQYLERERRLREHPWAARGMTTWMWTGEGGEILASCETYRMRSRLRGAGEGVTFGVASVFTEPALRRRGHCTRMMQALVARLRREPDVHASILFSDVGAPLYARAGYVARPGLDRVFDPLEGDPAEGVDALLGERDLGREMGRVYPPDDAFVIWPSAEQLDWHLERERIYSELLAVPRPSVAGARVGRSAAFWSGVLKDRRLVVLLLDARSAEEAIALVRAARRVAAAADLGEVRMWDVPLPFTWPSASGDAGRCAERKGELAMIAPLHPRLEADGWRVVARALWI